ncbi:MAG: outer membrane protein transport protein [Candidatus Krumholzibacteria bacterium]|nr:outer membrane protein transport protein [Candidatus Krumholzibacteria bacterium]
MSNEARNAPLDSGSRNKRQDARAVLASWCTMVAVLLMASAVLAQDINETVTIEDLGFTRRLHAGARPAALGGAYTALSDDVNALIYNPAGLAGVRSNELAVGFQHQRLQLENSFFSTASDVDLTTFKLDHLAFAYPVPTYRGSLVFAAGVYRLYSSYIDILNKGVNTDTSTNDEYLLQQSGSTYSYNFGGAIDLSSALSVGANLFFLNGTVDALTQFTFEILPTPTQPGQLSSETLVDDATVDVVGYGAVFGLQYRPHSLFQFGLSVSTPTPIDLQGDARQDDALYFSTPPDSFSTEFFAIDSEYTLPFRIDTGVSFSSQNMLVSVDLGYTDWTQTELNGRQIKDLNLRSIFREVLDFRVGVEVSIPTAPLRVRGGYSYEPYPLEFLQADRITGDQLQEAKIDKERQTVATGLGVLLGEVLNVDASFEYDIGERSIPTLTDKREMYRFALAASYRF